MTGAREAEPCHKVAPIRSPARNAGLVGRVFHLGAYLSHWHGAVRHDLSPSHSQTPSLSDLLALATVEDRARWDRLPLDYAAPSGASALRGLIAARYGGLTADDVVCCAGAQEAMACVAQALLSPGDHAVVVLPIYQPLTWTVTDRARATGVSLDPDDFRLDVDRIAAAIRPETRLVLVNFPNSPTGAVLSAADQAALVQLCRTHGLWLVNDEVYRQTASDPGHLPPSAVEIYERGVSINGLSKGFGLPGLRVGWVACRDGALLAAVATAKAALSSCIAAPAELLAQIALRAETALLDRTRSIGLANQRRLDRLLRQHAGLFDHPTFGNLAFAFPRYRGRDGASAFAARLAAEAGVLVLPSTIWRSPLGAITDDRLRISLGGLDVPAGLDAMETYLDGPRATSSDAVPG